MATTLSPNLICPMDICYLGYSLSLPELLRIFDIDFDKDAYYNNTMPADDIISHIDDVEEYFEDNSTKLRIYYIDKGLYVLGYRIDNLNYLDTLDYQSSSIVNNLKYTFMRELKILNANITPVKLQYLEDTETEIAHSPAPYLIYWYDE